jgi:hypothetical protein
MTKAALTVARRFIISYLLVTWLPQRVSHRIGRSRRGIMGTTTRPAGEAARIAA